MSCSYQWRPMVPFIVECVRWAYQAESFFCWTDIREHTNDVGIENGNTYMSMCVCVCIDPNVRNSTSPSHQRVHLTADPHAFIEPTSHQWHCKQFYTYMLQPTLFRFFPLSLYCGRFHWFHFIFHPPFGAFVHPFQRNGLMYFFARFNYDFKVCALHVTTWMLMIAATITVIHTVKCIPTLLQNILRRAIARRQQNEMELKRHEETTQKTMCVHEWTVWIDWPTNFNCHL